jgi:hypothetical protein
MKKWTIAAFASMGLAGKAQTPAKPSELLKVYAGRWELVGPEGKEQMKVKTNPPLCVLTSADVAKARGEKAVQTAIAALDELYAFRDKKNVGTLFRQVDPSHELVGVSQGREFVLERLFSTREAIDRIDSGTNDAAFALLKDLAKLCKEPVKR